MAALRSLTSEEEWTATAYAARQPRGNALWDQIITKLMNEVYTYCDFWSLTELPVKPDPDPWVKLEEWLNSEDAERFMAYAEDGTLPVSEAIAVLEEMEIEPDRPNLRR